MEQLTEYFDDMPMVKFKLYEECDVIGDKNGYIKLISKLTKRLAEYEDTGLTPEEINGLKSEIEKLKDLNEAYRLTIIENEDDDDEMKYKVEKLIKKLESEKEPVNGNEWTSGYNNGLTRAITLLCELHIEALSEISNLKKAMYVLLNDTSDVTDLDVRDSDDTFVDYIVSALIEHNSDDEENTCPFKNYDCLGSCESSRVECEEGLNICCERELEDVWRDFIGLSEVNK